MQITKTNERLALPEKEAEILQAAATTELCIQEEEFPCFLRAKSASEGDGFTWMHISASLFRKEGPAMAVTINSHIHTALASPSLLYNCVLHILFIILYRELTTRVNAQRSEKLMPYLIRALMLKIPPCFITHLVAFPYPWFAVS